MHGVHGFKISHDVWTVDNIFINNYALDECTYHCITQ